MINGVEDYFNNKIAIKKDFSIIIKGNIIIYLRGVLRKMIFFLFSKINVTLLRSHCIYLILSAFSYHGKYSQKSKNYKLIESFKIPTTNSKVWFESFRFLFLIWSWIFRFGKMKRFQKVVLSITY